MKRQFLIHFCALPLALLASEANAGDRAECGLAGEWSLVHISGWYCNACPVLYLDSDGEGSILLPSKERQEFVFTIIDDTIRFSFDSDRKFLDGSVFHYKVNVEGDLEYLQLMPLGEGNVYVFARGR